jgi:hypothetical protein
MALAEYKARPCEASAVKYPPMHAGGGKWRGLVSVREKKWRRGVIARPDKIEWALSAARTRARLQPAVQELFKPMWQRAAARVSKSASASR